MMQSDLFGRNDGAAPQIFHQRQAMLARERGEVGGGGRSNETAHEKIAAMNFQNKRGGFANRARVIRKCGFIGGANLA